MFNKVLIANRGEIALRILRTCREMGLETVAVYSEADRASLHVLEADRAVFIGDSEPLKSYLNVDRIIEAARETGSEAIHPGYGFLAENPDFAERCEQEGLVFIGPPGRVIRKLGQKTLARSIMKKADIPVIPGTLEGTTDSARLMKEAREIGYPLLVKAVAGGGGKGMRVVTGETELAPSLDSAMSEAQKAFGDGSLYLERLLEGPRHVEFQILADRFGNAVHLCERECSIQRRHQKIVEETPCPIMTPELRRRMGEAAVSAARASGYINAGTVEFLVDRQGDFYFLEVNTRLQVEHPITEMTLGVDLVRHQIDIAQGKPLSLRQEEVVQRGHAMECRIYAEDPEAHFFPSPGRILLHREPTGPGIRNDCGVYGGFEVPMDYDPILSKLVVWAETREAARRRMVRALRQYAILGIKTTVPFLLDVFRSEPFTKGEVTTHFVDQYFKEWKQGQEGDELARIAYVVDELLAPRHQGSWEQGPSSPPSPWETLGHWRLYKVLRDEDQS